MTTLNHSALLRTPVRRFVWAGTAWVLALGSSAAQNQLWIRQLGTSGSEAVMVTASDGSGGVIVSGNTDGPLGGPKLDYNDGWLARFDAAGAKLWSRQIGTEWDDWVMAGAPDGSGGAFVGG